MILYQHQMHNYQNGAVDHVIGNTHAGLMMEMGLGKTVSSLTAIKYLMYEELEINKTLVVAPKNVAENVWSAEKDKWDHLKGLKISRVIGSPKQRLAALKEEADIYVLGRDNVCWICGLYGGSMLPFDMLVIDESSSFKNHKSLRFKALRKVQPSFKRVLILTGTPAPNGLIDLWSQIYLLDRGERLGKFIGDYRAQYFKAGMRNGPVVYNYRIRKDAKEAIHDKVSDICMSMKSEDYLTLPGRINNYIDIVLPPKIKKQYDDFEEEQVLEIFADHVEGEPISAVNAAALSNKLLQFANGAVYDEDKNWHVVHDLKIEAAKQIVEQSGGRPVLIAYTYKHDKYRLIEALKKYKPVALTSGKNSGKIIKDWNAGKIPIMITHPASAGHGLNLQAGGNIIVWFGQTWSLELYQQFNARLDRQGQEEVVMIHHLKAVDTIDEKVIKALAGKTDTQESFMQAIKSKIKKYLKF